MLLIFIIQKVLTYKNKYSKNVEFKVKENKDKEDSFGLIAPVGNDSENPDKFPVIYLKKFNMVQQKETEIFVKVADDNSEMRITFSPAIPDIDLLKNNVEVNGRFSLSVDEIKGIMGGVYSVKKSRELHVKKA